MDALEQKSNLVTTLSKLYEDGREHYKNLKDRVMSSDYQKSVANAQALENVTERVGQLSEQFGDEFKRATEPETKYQKKYWFTSLPPEKNLMHKVFNQMDREKGIKTTGKIRIDYVDRETGQNVTMHVWPSALKYMSVLNPADNSKSLQTGKEIQSIQTQKSWGKLASRKPENDGWILDNGKYVFDSTYDVTWEIKTLIMGRDKAFDGDGAELFGDYDTIWFKTVPPQSDEHAYDLYNSVDPQKAISTDGFYRGSISLIYTNKEGSYDSGYYDLDILEYMTQQNPNNMASKNLRPGTEIRNKINNETWSKITSRRTEDDGWNLSNGRHVLDASYNIRWEVAEPVVEEQIE